MSESQNWFKFTHANEAAKFAAFFSYLTPDIHSYSKEIKILIAARERTSVTAKKAFCELLRIIIKHSSSAGLANFYKNFISLDNINEEIAEIVVDSIYDEARYRASANSSSTDDQDLYSLFSGYHKLSEALNLSLDGIINALISLYELTNLSFEEKRMHLIKETIPVIAQHAKDLSFAWRGKCEDIWLIFLISCLKSDLIHIEKVTESRFKSFFSEIELAKIQRMSPENLQTYLAAAAAENNNLREAKNLMKTIQEIGFFLKELAVLEKALEITPEMLNKARHQLQEKSKLDIELLKSE